MIPLTLVLLIIHGMVSVFLLGGLTHQVAASIKIGKTREGFFYRYRAVNGSIMVNAIVAAYLITFVLGALIYPAYRLDVRIALVEMRLPWAVGLFEVKEHWAAIGLAALPLYRHLWRFEKATSGRFLLTLMLAAVVWFNFVVGHLVNNLRGL